MWKFRSEKSDFGHFSFGGVQVKQIFVQDVPSYYDIKMACRVPWVCVDWEFKVFSLWSLGGSNMVNYLKHIYQWWIRLSDSIFVDVGYFHSGVVPGHDYVGTVNGPTSITRLAVWKMYQKVASFSFLDTPPQNRH